MKHAKLTVTEKIYIILRSHKDVKKNRFQTIASESVIKAGDNKVFSPFIIIELSNFIAKRSRLLGKRILLINLHTDKFIKRYRIACFLNALEKIDERISEIESNLKTGKEKYEKDICELQDKYNEFIRYEAYHNAQHCINQANLKYEKYRDCNKKMYDDELALINEKIRIINEQNIKINMIKEWRYLRIRYYYGQAYSFSPDTSMNMCTSQDFEKIMGERLESDHTEALDISLKKRDDILLGINLHSDIKIIERS